ncbi:MAG: ribosome silencing factor [Deltaproteobacteria bacterium]|nr:MAG: ribosome silencing factor [Deltaproteobacteria bacterium]
MKKNEVIPPTSVPLPADRGAGKPPALSHPAEKYLKCVIFAQEKKAEDIVVLDMQSASSSYTDYCMICSGNSTRQVQAIADSIERNLRREGIRPLGIEGYNVGEWILVDYGDVVVHIFLAENRRYYDLEGLWADRPRIDFSREIGQALSCGSTSFASGG